jgi:membrane associated rhomboid family serine protease
MVINRFYLWQFFTYMFLHGGFFHLLFNMFVLWMFGSEIEGMWGSRDFIRYYFFTGIGAGILTVLTSWNSPIPTIGASGAIYGILVAFAMLFPNRLIYLYFLFPIKAKHLVILFVVMELFASQRYSESGIANFAHLGGMLFGYIYIRWIDAFRSFFDRMTGSFRGGAFRIRVIDEDEESDAVEHREEDEDEIDRVLDKISMEGIDSLTEEEKEILNRASRRYRRKR